MGTATLSKIQLVSVVMPTLNQAQFIEESIASVLSQSYSRLELIVADGGSTDGTQAILARWQQNDVRLRWFSEKDHGPADAVNKALAHSRGTYVGWLNSDDLYTIGAVQRAVNELADGSGKIMVYGECENINENGFFINSYPTHRPQVGIKKFEEGCFICQPTVFFRRSMYLLLGELDISLHTAFDFDYWLRAFKAFPDRIGFIDQIQAQSRMHRNCITNKMRRAVALEGARVLKQHLGHADLHWILTHFHEVKEFDQSVLKDYCTSFVKEASSSYSAEDFEYLLYVAYNK